MTNEESKEATKELLLTNPIVFVWKINKEDPIVFKKSIIQIGTEVKEYPRCKASDMDWAPELEEAAFRFLLEGDELHPLILPNDSHQHRENTIVMLVVLKRVILNQP